MRVIVEQQYGLTDLIESILENPVADLRSAPLLLGRGRHRAFDLIYNPVSRMCAYAALASDAAADAVLHNLHDLVWCIREFAALNLYDPGTSLNRLTSLAALCQQADFILARMQEIMHYEAERLSQ
jgi:hypothetical protein